ncbi:MAG TPA: hypothetical protein VJG83_00995 [archaeon]|nr:hypothetical protein [archaeon]
MKEGKIIRKIKRLLWLACVPKWLHHFGPKKFEFWKRLYGGFLYSHTTIQQRKEVLLSMIADNLRIG